MKRKLFILILLIFNFFELLACFWDKDTLEMEKQQFPETAELISGNFLRHSSEFHQWRIEDRKEKINRNPSQLSLYDDLAVSYSKIGEDKNAIDIILKKDKIQSGIYETYANLGTFYIHDGELEKGIESIDLAIKINPEAHFGREIYQRYLAEYVLSKRKNEEIKLPLSPQPYSIRVALNQERLFNFSSFLLKKSNPKKDSSDTKVSKPSKDELEKAIKGIKGMMKFGNHNSPILLEVLGDLLISVESRGKMNKGARRLAGLCYLKASYEVKGERTKKSYERKAKSVIEQQYNFSFSGLEKLLKKENKKGENYFQQIRENEINWINSGKNPEVEFSKKYYGKSELPKKEVIVDTNHTLTKVETADTTKVEEIKEKIETPFQKKDDEEHPMYYLVIGLILLISILSFGFWKMKRNKK